MTTNLSAANPKPYAPGARSEPANVQFGFGDKHALIFLLNRRGVSGRIDQRGERNFALGRLKSGRVAQLGWRFLSAEEEFGGYNILQFVGAQQMLRRILRHSQAQEYRHQRSNGCDPDILHEFALDKK